MPPQLTFTLLTDPREAKVELAGLVASEPEAMSVVASVVDGLVSDPARCARPRWWVGRDGSGEVVAALMHTPPYLLHVAHATAYQAGQLATLLAAEGDDLPGVGGLRGPAEAFAKEWSGLTGAAATVTMEIGRFDLPVRPRLPFDVPGHYRRATGEDAAVVAGWHQEFVDTIESEGRKAPPLAGPIAAGRVGLWIVDRNPVSMAYASPANGGVTRIAGVWTPPDLRGHGYASAVVAALSTERQDAGESCMLYTDLANPTSNDIYEALGYRRVGDSISIAFSARPGRA